MSSKKFNYNSPHKHIDIFQKLYKLGIAKKTNRNIIVLDIRNHLPTSLMMTNHSRQKTKLLKHPEPIHVRQVLLSFLRITSETKISQKIKSQ